MKRIVVLLVCFACILLNARAGELYRWLDSSGNVYYGDVLPAGALQVEVKKFPKDTSSNEYLPYETLRAQQNFPVVLYVADNCGEPCDLARSLLSERGIPFSQKSLKTNKEIDMFKQLSGSDAVVPTLMVGKELLKGLVETQWNSVLDIAGYPKTASYRQSTEAPSTPAAQETASEGGQTNPQPGQ